MTVSEKVAYLKGLIAGSDLQLGTKEKSIMDAMVAVLEEVGETIKEFDEDINDLYDGIDVVCDNLEAIEEDLDVLFDERADEPDDILYDFECPNCKHVVGIDEDTLLDGDLNCPYCGQKLELELDYDTITDAKDDSGDEQK